MNQTSNDTPGKKHPFLTNLATNTAASTHSTPSMNSKNKPPKYTSEQYEKLKTMTKGENLKVTCRKCGKYFYDDKTCDHPSKKCYNCNGFGHISKDCPKPQKKKGNNCTSIIKNFNCNLTKISVLTDSAASHHIT